MKLGVPWMWTVFAVKFSTFARNGAQICTCPFYHPTPGKMLSMCLPYLQDRESHVQHTMLNAEILKGFPLSCHKDTLDPIIVSSVAYEVNITSHFVPDYICLQITEYLALSHTMKTFTLYLRIQRSKVPGSLGTPSGVWFSFWLVALFPSSLIQHYDPRLWSISIPSGVGRERLSSISEMNSLPESFRKLSLILASKGHMVLRAQVSWKSVRKRAWLA